VFAVSCWVQQPLTSQLNPMKLRWRSHQVTTDCLDVARLLGIPDARSLTAAGMHQLWMTRGAIFHQFVTSQICMELTHRCLTSLSVSLTLCWHLIGALTLGDRSCRPAGGELLTSAVIRSHDSISRVISKLVTHSQYFRCILVHWVTLLVRWHEGFQAVNRSCFSNPQELLGLCRLYRDHKNSNFKCAAALY